MECGKYRKIFFEYNYSCSWNSCDIRSFWSNDGRIPARYAVLSIIAGPLCVLAGSVFIRLPFDPLFLGMIVGLVIMAAGYVDGRKNSSDTCSCSR